MTNTSVWSSLESTNGFARSGAVSVRNMVIFLPSISDVVTYWLLTLVPRYWCMENWLSAIFPAGDHHIFLYWSLTNLNDFRNWTSTSCVRSSIRWGCIWGANSKWQCVCSLIHAVFWIHTKFYHRHSINREIQLYNQAVVCACVCVCLWCLYLHIHTSPLKKIDQ